MVTLEKISNANFEALIALELQADQEVNLPSNVYSIAESTLSDTYFPDAICLGGQVVGFVMYQFGQIGDFDEGECTIWRFMVDRRHQNQGIGKAAMPLVLKDIIDQDRCGLIDIYYDPANTAAKRLYTRFGFVPTGVRDDGDVIAELPVARV